MSDSYYSKPTFVDGQGQPIEIDAERNCFLCKERVCGPTCAAYEPRAARHCIILQAIDDYIFSQNPDIGGGDAV